MDSSWRSAAKTRLSTLKLNKINAFVSCFLPVDMLCYPIFLSTFYKFLKLENLFKLKLSILVF